MAMRWDLKVESILFCRVNAGVWEKELFINGSIFSDLIKEEGFVMVVKELLGATRELELGRPHIDSLVQPFPDDVAEDFPVEQIFRGDKVHVEVNANHEDVLFISKKTLDDIEKARLSRGPISLKGQMEVASASIEVDVVLDFVQFPLAPAQEGILLNRSCEIVGILHQEPRD